MNQQPEHQISEESVQLSQKHGDAAAATGARLEQLGHEIGQLKKPGAKIRGTLIENYGREMKQAAEVSNALTDELGVSHSTETFVEIVEKHVDAANAHVEAVKEFLKPLDS